MTRSETFHEMRLITETALVDYAKRNKIKIGAVRSVAWFPYGKVNREGVEANMYDHGKKWLLEATLTWTEDRPCGNISFDRNKVVILEL